MVTPSKRLAMTTALALAMVALATGLAMATSVFVAMEISATHQARALPLQQWLPQHVCVFCQQMAWAALLTSYGHGSPDNAFGCGNSTGYDDGRSGTRVATATSLAMAMAALTELVAMATALAMARVAPATRLASVARWDQ